MKYLLVILAILCVPSQSNAQSSAYGVRVGLNTITQNDSKRETSLDQRKVDYYTLPGFAAGVEGYLYAGSNFALGAQLLYLTRGYRYQYEVVESPWGPFGQSGSSRFQYLEFPLSLRYTFADVRLRPYFYGGVSLGLYLNGTDERDGRIQSDNSNFEKEDNLAVLLGAGVQYDILAGTSLVLDLTYSGDISSSTDEEQLRLLRLMLGVAFW